MALKLPKRVKHRKEHRGRIRGNATRGNTVKFGEFGIQALEPGWITARQIEAGRVAAGHFLAGEGRLWIRIFPHKPITSTPAETRMGKGKGEPEFWVCPVKPGTVMYEVGGIPKSVAKEAMARIAQKLPIRSKLIERKAVA